jgi:ribosomal protein S27AE
MCFLTEVEQKKEMKERDEGTGRKISARNNTRFIANLDWRIVCGRLAVHKDPSSRFICWKCIQ